MKRNQKWNKIGSQILTVCLTGSLLLSDPGMIVLAEESMQVLEIQDEEGEMALENQDEECVLVMENEDADGTQILENPDEEEKKQVQEIQNEDSGEENTEEEENQEDFIETGDTEEYEEELVEEDSDIEEDIEPNTDEEESETTDEVEEFVLGDEEEIAVDAQSNGELIQNPEWTVESGVVSVAGNGTKPSTITVAASAKRSNYSGDKSVVFGYVITSENAIDGNVNITVTDCGIMSDDNSVEIWKVTENGCVKLDSAIAISEGKVTFSADGLGEYLAVSNVATVDLSKGNVTVTENAMKGTQQDGTLAEIPFSDAINKKYRIAQNNQTDRCGYSIDFVTSTSYTQNRTLILDGINTTKDISIPAKEHTVMVRLLLRNTNQVHRIYYGTANQLLKDANANSSLKIDDYTNSGGNSGELYIPYKMETQSTELNYVLTKAANGIGENWSQAGIGGGRDGEMECCTGLTIAGGTIRVLVQNKNGATAIGGGGNGDAQLSITGGNVTAICSSTGAAIGGGIGWVNRGGVADVSITGGNVYAENIDQYTRSGISYGGVAIGSGSSMQFNGSEATVEIGGKSNVTAYAHYGNGIGSGNSYQGTAAKATIKISGNANVRTNALGGGTSKENQGGAAEISISDNAVVNCVKYSDITEKWDNSGENVLGAFGVGGGNSAGDAKGGSAVVNMSGGSLNCNGGNVGGGDAIGTGAGGDASINISGGTLDCASIGGGNSVSGTPGSVASDSQEAGIIVTGGTLRTGTIGGGKNYNDDIGYATAEISGGNIQGQFILANTDLNKRCFFRMTGGTIDNSNLGNGNYQKAQANGGAVYLSDPNGKVEISGGILQNAAAELGGAVYMSHGSFTLSGNAAIQNCTATGDSTTKDAMGARGGAVYLDNGTITMSGGCVLSSHAAQGGAIYLKQGTVTLSNGTIGNVESANTATEGAGVYVAGGNLTVNGGSIMYNEAIDGAGAYLQDGIMTVSNGQILHNTSKNSGAGAYLAGGTLTVSGGTIKDNMAVQNGGGVYLANGNMTLSGGSITDNQAATGAGAYLNSGNLTICGGGDFDHNTASKNGGGAYLAGGALTMDSGTFNYNKAEADGGGAYLAGGTLTINGGSFGNNAAVNGGAAYAADGKVRMLGGYVTGNTATQNGGGFYVSSDTQAADVVIRSGHIEKNVSLSAGGGIAVINSANDTTATDADTVILGLLEAHTGLDTDQHTFTPFDYTESTDNQSHNHAACPVLNGNQATGDGGGIYMNSSDAKLYIYCLNEDKNISKENTNGNSVMTVGGTVVIGDDKFNGSATMGSVARGNIVINSSMLIEGGKVDIWGTMKNPLFNNNILVDMRENAGTFNDHRQQASSENGKEEYKVHYFENFTDKDAQTATGLYTAIQYSADEDVTARGTIFQHTGWKIIGWNTQKDGTGIQYNIGEKIGSEGNHTAWGNSNNALILYAIWQRTSYVVIYNENANGNSVSGTMENQSFNYGETASLRANAYKINGKRFAGWNTQSDGTGTYYAADYNESRMATEDGVSVTLYAQWVNCTHTEESAHPGTVIYTADESKHTITESCDCGYTGSVTLNAVTVYYDGQTHSANLTSSGNMFTGTPTITYQYKSGTDGGYGDLPEGKTVPEEIGFYKATITVSDRFVSVEYEIKSPTDGITISSQASAGQHFSDFQGESSVSVPQDDAFTMQFTVLSLNTELYQSEPTLSFETALPDGTTIIMQTGNTYWYLKSPSQSIHLSDFVQMGGTGKFQYNANVSQSYRFIVDFSHTDQTHSIENSEISLTYAPTNVAGNLSAKITLSTTSKSEFAISNTTDGLSVTAPERGASSRWNSKNLMLLISPDQKNKISADTKLRVSDGNTTTEYLINVHGQFIVPIIWKTSQTLTLQLRSDMEAMAENGYQMTTKLCVMASDGKSAKMFDTSAQTTINVDIARDNLPSLKISGDAHVLTLKQSLSANIEAKNIDGCTIEATIQKKTGDTYSGNYLTKNDISVGSNSFSLAAITEPGSYCLYVYVSKAAHRLLSVPYYFIVQ